MSTVLFTYTNSFAKAQDHPIHCWVGLWTPQFRLHSDHDLLGQGQGAEKTLNRFEKHPIVEILWLNMVDVEFLVGCSSSAKIDQQMAVLKMFLNDTLQLIEAEWSRSFQFDLTAKAQFAFAIFLGFCNGAGDGRFSGQNFWSLDVGHHKLHQLGGGFEVQFLPKKSRSKIQKNETWCNMAETVSTSSFDINEPALGSTLWANFEAEPTSCARDGGAQNQRWKAGAGCSELSSFFFSSPDQLWQEIWSTNWVKFKVMLHQSLLLEGLDPHLCWIGPTKCVCPQPFLSFNAGAEIEADMYYELRGGGRRIIFYFFWCYCFGQVDLDIW